LRAAVYHLHDAIFDRHGNAPAFYEHFRLETRDALIDKLAYIATNPIKDGLVERVGDWPGASGYRALLSGQPLRATRPKHFLAAEGVMPEAVMRQPTFRRSSVTSSRSYRRRTARRHAVQMPRDHLWWLSELLVAARNV
jgi:hypothetical protein